MEQEIIEFKKSPSGTPYFIVGSLGRFIFSKLTAHPIKGYKFMCFSHEYIDEIPIKNTNNKRNVVSIPASHSYIINMKLEREKNNGSKSVGLPHNTIPGRMKDFLKKNLEPLVEEGYLPFGGVDTLKDRINGKEIDSILSEIQKERKKRKSN